MPIAYEDLTKIFKDILEYRNGALYWLIDNPPVAKGDKAGSISNGYVQIRRNKKTYSAHRIIWEFANGPIPDDMFIDHIDRNRSNNVLSNLRLASKSQNGMNRGVPANNTTGVKGVTKQRNGLYQAQLRINTRNIYLGRFEDIKDAEKAYLDAAAKHFKEFLVLQA